MEISTFAVAYRVIYGASPVDDERLGSACYYAAGLAPHSS